MAVALCAIITTVAIRWLMAFEAANTVMLYLLGWVIIIRSMAAGRRLLWRR